MYILLVAGKVYCLNPILCSFCFYAITENIFELFCWITHPTQKQTLWNFLSAIPSWIIFLPNWVFFIWIYFCLHCGIQKQLCIKRDTFITNTPAAFPISHTHANAHKQYLFNNIKYTPREIQFQTPTDKCPLTIASVQLSQELIGITVNLILIETHRSKGLCRNFMNEKLTK